MHAAHVILPSPTPCSTRIDMASVKNCRERESGRMNSVYSIELIKNIYKSSLYTEKFKGNNLHKEIIIK